METILRSEEMAEIMLLPVRHHSPACSFQIRKVIKSWKPSAVLIEGPYNANDLIPVMVHEDTRAPFAIYYSYHDKTGRLAGLDEEETSTEGVSAKGDSAESGEALETSAKETSAKETGREPGGNSRERRNDREFYKCYYPFLDYSPELLALREAAREGLASAFIDLPYADILAASKEGKGLLKEEEKNNYNDDYLLSRNVYLERLCEKTGLRNFDEFWEKYFEVNGLTEESETWFSHLLTYCRLARENTPIESLLEEGCLEREAHMAARIVQWVEKNGAGAKKNGKKGKAKKKAAENDTEQPSDGQTEESNVLTEAQNYKILVITGGFHTPGILERLSGENWAETKKAVKKLSEKKDKNQSVYLMPYSMEAADALNGYSSGMPYAGFYQRIWNNISDGETESEELEDVEDSEDTKDTKKTKNTKKTANTEKGKKDNGLPVEQAYRKAVLDLIVASGKELRRKEGYLSTYDEICAWQMAQGLSDLRNKPQPGAYELKDAVLSSYVKGEYNLASDTPIRILQRLMIGNATGRLCDTADVPPILHDFEQQCKSLGLKTNSTLEAELTLSIFSGKKHRNTSMFFHRMVFLETGFARRIKGPNLQLRKDRNLIREIWKYKWSAQVPAALIDVSVHGATVEEAACSIVREQLRKEIGAGAAASLLTQVFEMGLTEQLEEVYGRVQEQMLADTDFYSIAEAIKSLMMMEELGTLYGSVLELAGLLKTGVQKLIMLLPSMTGIKDENLSACMDALKLLYQVTGRERMEMTSEQEAYYSALYRMLAEPNIHAGLYGCIHGILYGSGREDSAAVELACRGYLTGTREQLLQTALFFRGLFYTAKDLIFIGGQILGMLDSFFGQVEEEEFMELLPELRMAFTYFTPAETDKIAGMAAGLHGKKREDITERTEVLPEWYTYGKELDEYARACMF